jgi:cyclase
MSSVRVIPRLDIKGPNLVKGIHLEGLRVLGKPEYFAKHYYESGADELLYMDVVASLYGRNSLVDIIERTSREIFIPLTVGGGLRSLEDIRAVLRAGADKVTLNTAAIREPELIRRAARRFGSSTVVISIEAIRKPDGTYEAFTDNGREETGVEVFEWARRVEELGAGEILITSIDREGTGKGYDLELTRKVAELVGIPVIACGGAGRAEDAVDVVARGKADAVSAASIFHYNYIKQHPHQGDFSGEGNVEFLRGSGSQKVIRFSKIRDTTIPELKQHLTGHGIECRQTKADSGNG